MASLDENKPEDNEVISSNQVVFEEKIEDTPPQFSEVPLDVENPKKKKTPKRILHFSDGILEEYSTDEEEEEEPPPPPVDPKTLDWLPWFWFYIVFSATKALAAADFCGEHLAWFFGITTPKYQYIIDEYHRMKEEEEEEKRKEEAEKITMLASGTIVLDDMEGGMSVLHDEKPELKPEEQSIENTITETEEQSTQNTFPVSQEQSDSVPPVSFSQPENTEMYESEVAEKF